MTALGLNGFITAQGRSSFSVATKTVAYRRDTQRAARSAVHFRARTGVCAARQSATVLSQAVSAAWCAEISYRKKHPFSGCGAQRCGSFTAELARRLAPPPGASPFVVMSTESLLTVAFNVSLQKYGGDLAVGAMTILTSVAQMIQLPLTGLAQGAQPILSYNFGVTPPDHEEVRALQHRARRCVRRINLGIVHVCRMPVVHLFTSDTSPTRYDGLGAAHLHGARIYERLSDWVSAVVRGAR